MYKLILRVLGKKHIEPKKTISSLTDYQRLEKFAKGKKNLKLHVGCGPRVLKGWINIDLAYEPFKNYLKYYTNKYYGKNVRGKRSEFFAMNVANTTLPIKNNTVSVVFHEDFIEHLDQKEQFMFLSEMYRVLQKGGIHRINTPDIKTSMRLNSDFTLGLSGVYQAEWDKHIHKNVLSVSVLREMATIIGYKRIVVQKRDQSLAKIPLEYRPDPNDRPESGNLHVDLIK